MWKFRPAFANFQLTILLQSYCIFFVLFKYVVTGTLLEKSLLSIPCSASVLKWLLFIPKSIFSSFSCNMKEVLAAVWRIRIILIRIRTQDVKKFVADPDPGRTLIRIRIQAKRYGSGFQIQPIFYTDSDPGKWYGFYGSGSATLVLAVLKPILWIGTRPCWWTPSSGTRPSSPSTTWWTTASWLASVGEHFLPVFRIKIFIGSVFIAFWIPIWLRIRI